MKRGFLAMLLAFALACPVFAWAEPSYEIDPGWAAGEDADASSEGTPNSTTTGEGADVVLGEASESGEPGEEKPIDESNLVNPQQRPDSSFIYDALISDLAGADSYLNGQIVQVTGEVVGDRIYNGLDRDHCWITLQAQDSSYAEISVFMTVSSAELIDTFGVYGKTGTTLQVRGTFQLACKEHQGMTDIHADNVTVVEGGHEHPDEFVPTDFIPGIISVVIGLFLVLLFHRMRESRR